MEIVKNAAQHRVQADKRGIGSSHQALLREGAIEEWRGYLAGDAVLAFQPGAEAVRVDDDAVGIEQDGVDGLIHANIMA